MKNLDLQTDADSKEWQKELLPEGTKGTTELKKASLDMASRMFPTHIDTIKKQKDGDGIESKIEIICTVVCSEYIILHKP